MSSVLKSIHHFEHRFDACAERLAFRHPYAAVLVMFIVMPVFILLAVAALTTIVTLPFTLLFM